jgi:xylan 1,4-beta-xylosidase
MLTLCFDFLRCCCIAVLSQSHLRAVKRDINPQYVRFHGLLDDDMSVVLDTNSYFNVFSVFDFLLSIGMRPIVELSFMPEALASNASQTIFHYKGGISPPADYNAWAALITDVVTNLVNRYGIAEVRQWKFEVWNEFNCGFWSGTMQEYFTLYNYTGTCCGHSCL